MLSGLMESFCYKKKKKKGFCQYLHDDIISLCFLCFFRLVVLYQNKDVAVVMVKGKPH